MILYLHRHAIAEDFDDARHRQDADRALTRKGECRERAVAEELRRLGERIDAIWTSPYRRARETAAILHEVHTAATLSVVEELAGYADYAEVLELLRARPVAEHPASLALVGHEPCLGELAGLLLHADRHAGFAFKRSGVARFRVGSFGADPCAILESVWTPKDLLHD